MLDSSAIIHCRLGSDHGPEFARAVASTILNQSFEIKPSWREICYAEFLEEDLSNGRKDFFAYLTH